MKVSNYSYQVSYNWNDRPLKSDVLIEVIKHYIKQLEKELNKNKHDHRE